MRLSPDTPGLSRLPRPPTPLVPTPVPLCRVLLCPNSVQMQAKGAACHPTAQVQDLIPATMTRTASPHP